MTTIFIPCSKLSKAVILRMYSTTEDVHLSSYDALSDLIYNKPVIPPTRHIIENVLIEKVSIKVNDQYARTIAKTPERLGRMIHEYHMSMIMNFLHFAELSGLSVRLSIDKFYETYNIGDDEIPIDTILKRHQRSKKNIAIFEKKKGGIVHSDSKKMITVKNVDLYKSYEKLGILINQYFNNNESFFYTKKCTFKKILFYKLRAYIYYTVGNKSIAQISKRTKTPEKTVYARIASFREDLRYLPEIDTTDFSVF